MTSSSQISVTTGPAGESQGQLACNALRSQRLRFGTLLRSVSDGAWTAQTRCTEWTVHEVVRHLCDLTLKSTALLQGAPAGEVEVENMDPRTAPIGWLSRSADESPRETLAAFEDATGLLLAEVDRRSGAASDVDWLYGTVPWSIAVLHVFWDAWIHERDILIPLGRQQESPAVESCAAAAYGLLMAGLPSLALDRSLDETLVLAGDGGGAFRLEARSDGQSGRQLTMAGYPAAGTITVIVGDSVDDDSEPLRGALVDVVDSLVGREPDLVDALGGPAERVQHLSLLRTFMRLPAS